MGRNKKNIPEDYKLILSERIKDYIIDYFEENKNKEKLINKKNFTFCLRKILSRYISGLRQDVEIKSDAELKLFINKEDLWNKDIIDSNLFDNEIFEIFKYKIIIGQIWDLYNLLEGDNILNEELHKNDKIQEINNENELNEQFMDKDDELRNPEKIYVNDIYKRNYNKGESEQQEEEEDENDEIS